MNTVTFPSPYTFVAVNRVVPLKSRFSSKKYSDLNCLNTGVRFRIVQMSVPWNTDALCPYFLFRMSPKIVYVHIASYLLTDNRDKQTLFVLM